MVRPKSVEMLCRRNGDVTAIKYSLEGATLPQCEAVIFTVNVFGVSSFLTFILTQQLFEDTNYLNSPCLTSTISTIVTEEPNAVVNTEKTKPHNNNVDLVEELCKINK